MEENALLDVAVDYDRCVNFAMEQNDVPVVRLVRLTNQGEGELKDIVVRVSIDSDISDVWTARVDALASGKTYNLERVGLVLRADVLARQLEREKTAVVVEVSAAGDVHVRHELPIEVLAYNEWGGTQSLPEIAAAFVLPNHPANESILGDAGRRLGQATGRGALDGYQSNDPLRTLAITRAIYEAAAAVGISYINPPASFEQQGQKVRLPEQIVKNKLGTCLDLAMFLAGLFEQAGLHALLIIIDGHAFAGAWRIEDHFPEPAIDDGTRIGKRVALGEIVVVEATGLSDQPASDFSAAVDAAFRHLEDPTQFVCAIDIRCARKVRIRPLPLRLEVGSVEVILTAPSVSPVVAAAPMVRAGEDASISVREPAGGEEPEKPKEEPHERLKRWKRRLLDLSLRNKLINYRPSAKSLPLMGRDLATLEDALAQGMVFHLWPKPKLMSEDGPRDAEVHRARTGEDAVAAYVRERMSDGCLHLNLTDAEYGKSVLALYREARTAIEETGSNLLYLAAGMLQWYESGSSEKPRLAPIVLLPVRLDRESVSAGFRLALADEEPRINTTLLEKMKTEFPIDVTGLDELPEDDAGLDIARILRNFRVAVKDMPRWDVLEEAHVGLFSFTKFLMWLDLEARADILMDNAVVDQLVNRPDRELGGGLPFPDTGSLDRERSPADTYCPLDADSSQLAAIFAAHDGRSFVLEGPPGTGKSQTITNLIAHFLGHGKRVLFVSEKMAALNVVHQRLSKVGLASFCLELHSNKVNKKHVHAQLAAALEAGDPGVAREWETATAELASLRDALNGYVEAEHRVRPIGESVFRVRARLTGLRKAPRVSLDAARDPELNEARLRRLKEIVEQLRTAADRAGDVANHPLRAARREEWSGSLPDQVDAALQGLDADIREDAERWEAASSSLSIPGSDPSAYDLEWAASLARRLLETPGPGRALLTEPGFDDLRSRLRELLAQGRHRDEQRGRLLARYGSDLLDHDVENALAVLERGMGALPVLRWFKCRGVRKELSRFAKGKALPANPQLLSDLKLASSVRSETVAIQDRNRGGEACFAAKWRDGEADWDALEGVLEWAHRLRAQISSAPAPVASSLSTLRDTVVSLACDERDLLSGEATIGQTIRGWLSARESMEARRIALTTLVDLDESIAFGEGSKAGWYARVLAWIDTARSQRHLWNDWCFYRRQRSQAVGAGLRPLVDLLECGQLPAGDLSSSLLRSIYEGWLNATTDREPVLRDFNSAEHERRIARFRHLDRKGLDLGKRQLQNTLIARTPSISGEANDASELGILKRELGKQRRHMSVRKLAQKLQHLLPRLKPCFLMSPLSVAQYLDPSFPTFDIVVFDEASQIPVWDAVGAMARGRQVIVVGDSKQLPPTNFFMKGEDDDEAPADDEFEEMESVLEDCVASLVPRLRLLWHYRSRHESLIAFSNYHYYDNRLLTFPSPEMEAERLGVSFRHLPSARYDKGKSRTNREEATAIVAEITARLLSHASRGEVGDSIGVVTFSQAQQSLVEDLLDEERRKHPEIESFFGESAPEPVFVKNLENVQGDERDVILFSICFGPDEQGRVSMSFGPLNRDGGERRLNVAITRARKQVVVFSSIRADQIDLARTRSVGVKHLKTFLDYADRGPAAIAEAVEIASDADFDSPFEKEVFDALVARGHDVNIQVGCSGYRIDLAVKDPERPGRYLIGIECDGAYYHSAKTARDRDRLREAVLRGLGWQLVRIWSTDWWIDRDRQIDRVEQAIEAARACRDIAPKVIVQEAVPAAANGSSAPERADEAVVQEIYPGKPSLAPEELQIQIREDSVRMIAEAAVPPLAEGPGRARRYTLFAAVTPRGMTQTFYLPTEERSILVTLEHVVREEGPILFDVACRRVGAAWQMGRVTKKAIDHIRGLVRASGSRFRLQDDCLWPEAFTPDTFREYRVPEANQAAPRSADEIPPLEIANAAEHVLERQISLPADALAKEVALAFGFARVGKKVLERMEAGIAALERRGGCVSADGRVRLP